MKKARLVILVSVLLSGAACGWLPGINDTVEPQTPAERFEYSPVNFIGNEPTEAERNACANADGIVEQAGLLGAQICVQQLPDANAACTDSSDCIAQCLATAETSSEFGVDAVGACQASDNPFGCFELVTHGKRGPALCVD